MQYISSNCKNNQNLQPKGLKGFSLISLLLLHKKSCKGFSLARGAKVNTVGFTLIELLIVVAIIAVLAVVGVTVFTNVTKNARDGKRRADVEAISKTYEVKNASQYQEIMNTDFSTGSIPSDPRGNSYFRFVSSSGYKVCASLDNSPNQICNTPSTNCLCQTSQQGTLGSGDTALPGSGYGSSLIGVGGSTPGSCDNILIPSTYNSSATTGWSPQLGTSHIAITTDGRFTGNVLQFYSDVGGSASDRVWGSGGAQTVQFLQNYTYKVSFTYTATANFALRSRDLTFATVPINTGAAQAYSYTFNDTFAGGCNIGSCYILVGLPTPGMIVNIQNFSVSVSCN